MSDRANEIIKRLALVQENVLAEAAQLSTDFIEAGRYYIDQMGERAKAELTLDAAKATLALKLRITRDAEGKKITEPYIKQKIEVHSKIKALRRAFDEATQHEVMAKLILEAFRMKRTAVEIVANAGSYEGQMEAGEARKIQRQRMEKEIRRLARQREEIT